MPFSIDEQGNFYIGEGYTQYRENIFIVDLDMLSEYKLFGNFHNSELIELGWAATFEVEKNEMLLVVDKLNIEYGVSTIKEIRLNPFALLFIAEIDINEPSLGGSPEIKINTVNGIVNTLPSMASRSLSDELVRTESRTASTTETGLVDITWVYTIEKDFLDLNSVTSIEIAGEIVELR